MNNANSDESVDQDLLELFHRCGPVPTSVDAEEITSSRQRSFNRRVLVKTSFSLVVAASAVFVWFVFGTSDAGSSQAFAQVKEAIREVRSVSFVQRSYSAKTKLPKGAIDARFAPGENSDSALAKRIAELRGLMEQATGAEERDLRTKLRLLEEIETGEADELDDLRWVRIGDKHLQRTDSLFPIGRSHSVIDVVRNIHVSFDHGAKVRSILARQVTIDREAGTRTEAKIKFSPAVDFFKRWQTIPVEATRHAKNQEVDGKEVAVFHSTENHESGEWKRTYMVDLVTNLPVRVETVFTSAKKHVSSSRWVQDQFVFDAEMNADLFSTEEPDGYESQEQAIHGYRN